jgi:dTMP kinase
VLRPALEADAVVICDRYVDSTLANQGGGLGLSIAELLAVQEFATGGLAPDLRILLDLPVELGLQRRLAASAGVNRIDQASVAFHERVRSTYLRLAGENPDQWAVVDATGSPDRVTEQILEVVADRTRLLNERDVALGRPTPMRVGTDG